MIKKQIIISVYYINMQLSDKFNIIENHIGNDQIDSTNYLELYIHNLFNSSNKTIVSDYINQLLWFKLIDNNKLYDTINATIKKNLLNQRKIFRSEIKKNEFKLDKYILFLQSFKTNLNNLNLIFTSYINIYKINIIELSKIIISDSIILSNLENITSLFDPNYKSYINQLYDFCNNDISIYDKGKTTFKLVSTISESFNKVKILNDENNLLPFNIKSVYGIKILIDYLNNIYDYYEFINKDFINSILSKRINNDIFNILLLLTNYDNIIIEVFENCNVLYDLIIYNDNIFHLCTLLVNIIEKINTESFDSIKIIRILKIINTIYENMNNKNLNKNPENFNIHFVKIFMVLSSNIDNIIKTIDILIKEAILNEELVKTNLSIISDIIKIIYNKGLKYESKQQTKLHLDYFQQIIDTYYDYLIKRVLNYNFRQYEHYIYIEQHVLTDLKRFNNKLLYKIKLVIEDLSKINNLNTCNNYVLIGSYDAYPINYSQGIINTLDIDSQLGNYIKEYNTNYIENKTNNKKLNWYLHYGEIEMTYLDKDIKLLPIQFLILEIIEKDPTITVEKIIQLKLLSNYTKEYINKLLSSLIISGIVKNRNNKLSLMNDTTDITDTNLIDLFFNNIDYKPVQKEFAHTKKDIINATINHYLKMNPLSKSELYDKIKDDISLFIVEKEDYEKSLEYMIKMDYIKLNNGLYEKLLF